MKGKLGAVVAVLVAVAALAWIAVGDLGENLVYYWSPSEMMSQRDKAVGATIRLGGLVEAGSIANEGAALKFRVTDGTTAVAVASSGVPPQMFREGIGVVLEGTLTQDGTFTCTRMMVKHDNEYRAPTANGAKPTLDTLQEG
jgi:cytochrome c-type biogenesis protein CcmE